MEQSAILLTSINHSHPFPNILESWINNQPTGAQWTLLNEHSPTVHRCRFFRQIQRFDPPLLRLASLIDKLSPLYIAWVSTKSPNTSVNNVNNNNPTTVDSKSSHQLDVLNSVPAGHLRPLLVFVLTTHGHPIQLAPPPPCLAQSLLAVAARLVAIATTGPAGLQWAAVSTGD